MCMQESLLVNIELWLYNKEKLLHLKLFFSVLEDNNWKLFTPVTGFQLNETQVMVIVHHRNSVYTVMWFPVLCRLAKACQLQLCAVIMLQYSTMTLDTRQYSLLKHSAMNQSVNYTYYCGKARQSIEQLQMLMLLQNSSKSIRCWASQQPNPQRVFMDYNLEDG